MSTSLRHRTSQTANRRPARSPKSRYHRALLEAFEPRLLMSALPTAFHEADVGAPSVTGSSDYNATADSYAITGSGNYIWYSGDQFHFVYQQMIGDMSITVRLADPGVSNPSWIHPKAGLMIRQNLSTTAGNAAIIDTTTGTAAFQYRQPGDWTTYSSSAGTLTGPLYLKLTKSGDTITGYTSSDGSTWTTTGSQTIHFAGAYYVGMVVDSENSSVSNTATFDHFTLSGTALTALAAPWSNADVGSSIPTGDAGYSSGSQIYILDGGGTTIDGTADQFHYTYQTLTGDGSIIAHVADAGITNSSWALAGIMIRNGLATDAQHATITLAKNGTLQFKHRDTAATNGGDTYGTSGQSWLKLTKTGNTLTGYSSTDGTSWTLIDSASITMSGPIYIGLLADAGGSNDIQTAAFDSVTLTGAAPLAPPAPTNVTLTFPDSSDARLSWDPAPTGADVGGYDISMSTAGGPFIDLGDTIQTSFEVSGLLPNTVYGFHVSALDSDENPSSPASASGNSGAGILGAVIGSITIGSLQGGSSNSATVSWTNGTAGIVKSFVEIEENGSDNWFTLADAGTGTTATLFGLSMGTIYKVRVRSIANSGLSAYSSDGEIDIPDYDADPSIYDGPTVDTNNGYPQVTWTDTGTDNPERQILTQTDATPFPDRWYGTGSVETASIPLTDGDYAWLAGPTNTVLTKDLDRTVATGFDSGLSAPDGSIDLSGIVHNNADGTLNHVELNWTAQSGTQYAIMDLHDVAQDGWNSGTYNYDTWYYDPTIADYAKRGSGNDGSGGHYMDRPGYYAVAGYTTVNNIRQYSSLSNLLDLARAFTPQYMGAVISGTTAHIAWDNASYQETGFELQRSSDGGTTWADVATSNSDSTHTTNADVTTYTDTGLNASLTYKYRVRALRPEATLDSQWLASIATSNNASTDVLPELVVQEMTGGKYLSDIDNNPNSPGGVLATAPSSINPAIQSIMLLNHASASVMPGSFSYTVTDSSGHLVKSGSITQNDDVLWDESEVGLFHVQLSSSADPTLQRNIDVKIVKLDILWEGSDIVDKFNTIVVHTGDVLNGKTIGYLDGQHIQLSYRLDDGETNNPASLLWSVGKTTDFVDNYIITDSLFSHTAEVVRMTNTDLSQSELSIYGAANAPMRRFGLTVVVVSAGKSITFHASTIFDIKKPGQGIWPGTFTVDGDQQPATATGISDDAEIGSTPDRVSDHIEINVHPPLSEAPNVNFFQLINSKRTGTRTGPVTDTIFDTFGQFELDTQDPYLDTNGTFMPDSPFTPYVTRVLHEHYDVISIKDSFKTWAMWKPPGADSIWIPISMLTWNWAAEATYDIPSGTWHLTSGSPTIATIHITGSYTDEFPQWQARLT